MYWKYLYKIKIKTNSLLLQCTWSDIKFEFELYDYDKSHCLNLKLTSMMVYHHVVKVINLPRFDFRIIWKMYNNPRKELRAFASDTKKMSILYLFIYFATFQTYFDENSNLNDQLHRTLFLILDYYISWRALTWFPISWKSAW